MKVKIIQVGAGRYVVETARTGKAYQQTKEMSKDEARATVQKIFSAAIEQRMQEAEQAFQDKQSSARDENSTQDFDVVDFQEKS